MRSYQQGDELAFQCLYNRYHTKIYGYFVKKSGHVEVADELFQKFFLKFHEKRGLYDDRHPLLPWIFTICHHLYVDEMRLRARQLATAERFVQESKTYDHADAMQNESRASDLSQLIEEQLHHLNPRYQKALVMRYSDGKGFMEIADILATTPSTARKIVNRALHHLQALMRSKKHD